MKKVNIYIEKIPAVIYGNDSDKLYIYVHGKHGNKEEAGQFAQIAAQSGYQTVSFDLPEHGERKDEPYLCIPQNAVHDLQRVYSFFGSSYKSISLYACSIGTYFSLLAYRDITFGKCLFQSPILNMERLITNMMQWANVSPQQLEQQQEIPTSFGETLSWDYYRYTQDHPVDKWESNTFILYGENDNLTEREVLNSFSEKFNCETDVMPNGEHYFHTPAQLDYMYQWLRRVI